MRPSRTCANRFPDLPPHAWVACHRDLHDGQILISGGRPVLLDLDLLCAADPALDAGNLTAHFLLRELQAAGGADRESIARSRACSCRACTIRLRPNSPPPCVSIRPAACCGWPSCMRYVPVGVPWLPS
ncbi:MAG: phosphotransferase [Planctomycetota bacterium]